MGGGAALRVRRQFSMWERFRRLIHFRLVVPLKRSTHPPEYTARGVMIGLFWAFTPLVGIQMYLVFLTWLLLSRNQQYDFNLIVALAWTWVTNAFTMWPAYYAFYVTGQLMLGHSEGTTGYDNFVHAWQAALAVHGLVDKLFAYVRVVLTEQGLPMLIGCVPYALGSAALGYYWSLRLLVRHRRAKAERRLRRRRASQLQKP